MKATPEIRDCLRRQSLLQSSDDSVIDRVGAISRIVKLESGDHAFLQGDASSPLVLLLGGQLRSCVLTEHGHEIPIRVINAGDATGAEPILGNSPGVKSVVAVRKSIVAVIGRTEARWLLAVPEVARELNKRFARYMHDAVTSRSARGASRSTARVCAIIYAMVRESGKAPSTPVEIPTHSSLAAAAQVSRETVTRVLGQLSRRGIIVKERNLVHVMDAAALASLSSGEQFDEISPALHSNGTGSGCGADVRVFRSWN